MSRTDEFELTSELRDAIAWKFLGSEFTGRRHVGWPIEQRLDRYLIHQGLPDLGTSRRQPNQPADVTDRSRTVRP